MRLRRYTIKTAYILIDIFFVYLAIYLACWVRQGILPFDVRFSTLLLDEANPFRFIFAVWILSTVFLNSAHHLYETRRDLIEPIEIGLVIRSACLVAFVVVVGKYLLKIEGFPRSIFIMTIIG